MTTISPVYSFLTFTWFCNHRSQNLQPRFNVTRENLENPRIRSSRRDPRLQPVVGRSLCAIAVDPHAYCGRTISALTSAPRRGSSPRANGAARIYLSGRDGGGRGRRRKKNKIKQNPFLPRLHEYRRDGGGGGDARGFRCERPRSY